MDLEKKVLDANSFKEFNPMQKKVLDRDWKNENLVVGAPTASGKTVVAELTALNSIISRKRKVVYTCPLRALANEHYNDFKKKYSSDLNIRVSLSTGDLDSSSKYLSGYDIIFCTFEKLDSLTRHNADWLQQIGLLIVDEIHEIDSGRGPTLEMLITKLRVMNPKMQILALSATIPNAKELAEWLDASLVESDFRPVRLSEGVYFDDEIDFRERKEDIEPNRDAIGSLVGDTLKKEKQALIFANTRRRSEGIAKQLAPIIEKKLSQDERKHLATSASKILNVLESPTEQCKSLAKLVEKGVGFHNAGLLQKQREIIEELFRENYLKVVSATPTLAAGINLPAFRVIIPSLYRYTSLGNQRINVSEYKQMCLPYDTEIFTKEEGNIKIGDIVEKRLSLKALSLNTKKFKLEFNPITNYYKRKSKDIVKLTLENGQSLSITPNHRVLVSKNSSYEWSPSSKIKKGERVICLKKPPAINYRMPYFFEQLPKKETYVVGCGNLFTRTKKMLGITEKELATLLEINYKRIFHMKKNRKAMPLNIALKLCDLLGYSEKKKANVLSAVKSKNGTIIKLPLKPTKDFLWLVGFIATDGNINRSIDKRTKDTYAKIRVSNTNKDLIKKAEQYFSYFGLSTSKSKRADGLITLEVGATLLAKVLIEHYGLKYGNKTTSVDTPRFLQKAHPKFIGAYLGGVFDGDGNFNIAKQKRGKKSYVYRVLIATSSAEFASGLQKLLMQIGVVANLKKEKKNLRINLKGKIVNFSKPTYSLIFRKIEYIKTFSKYAKIHKTKINVKYSKYNNVNKRDKSDLDYCWLRVIKIKKTKSKKKVYNISVKGNENYFADSLLVHNCGRAGRPKYNESGEAILIARNEIEVDELFESYIDGEIEEVNSKLGIEPILRTHVLAAIASNFVFDLASMEEFFSKTFYAEQYRQLDEFFAKIMEIVQELEEMKFVESDEKRIRATVLGKRVSELYLDPKSAYDLINALQRGKTGELFYLFSFVNTYELHPLVSVPKKKEPELWELLQEEKGNLPINVDVEMFSDPELLKKFNTALLFQDWLGEVTEENLSKEYNIRPGILYSKLQIADWLVYCAFELSRLLKMEKHLPELNKLRKRLKYGIREELIYLTEVRNIGRIRARKLWNAGVKGIKDLKKTRIQDLAKILSPAIALKVKQQLGEKPTEKQIAEIKKISPQEQKKLGEI